VDVGHDDNFSYDDDDDYGTEDDENDDVKPGDNDVNETPQNIMSTLV